MMINILYCTYNIIMLLVLAQYCHIHIKYRLHTVKTLYGTVALVALT